MLVASPGAAGDVGIAVGATPSPFPPHAPRRRAHATARSPGVDRRVLIGRSIPGACVARWEPAGRSRILARHRQSFERGGCSLPPQEEKATLPRLLPRRAHGCPSSTAPAGRASRHSRARGGPACRRRCSRRGAQRVRGYVLTVMEERRRKSQAGRSIPPILSGSCSRASGSRSRVRCGSSPTHALPCLHLR